ncbi:MAG: glycoside hydrolase family 97 C-terminal domain-containing protein, partial [Flavisolibacter sp.]|nr:glycoside hydrolase family 97 C-terminal domain-containing protein [Flavisolibacter sp.]
VPTVWYDTKFVQGEHGKETVLARRKGDTWYIAGASGMDMQQNLQLQLPFLTGSSYQASVFSDGTSAREIKVSNTSVKKGGTLDITVLPKGGFVAVLKP